MSLETTLANKAIRSDPALSPFPIEIQEDQEAARWFLVGTAPSVGIKRRAGKVARGWAPRSVWLVNSIVIDPDDMSGGGLRLMA